jgi:hypothetical protein
MYFIIFVCIVLIVKAIVKMTWYQNDINFSYYDNISNIIIGIVLFGYVVKMMKNQQAITLAPSTFVTPSVSSMTPSISDTPSVSDYSNSSSVNQNTT